ncbi:MAG: hypothetical protein HUJ76_06400 [Parasporobacterium sp.]|nr:hypothetical protein [Parasporobacterium sp.]
MFPNLSTGTKNLFKSQILGIISAVLLSAGLVAALFSFTPERIMSADTSAVVVGIITLVGLLLLILSAAWEIFGLAICRKDDRRFSTLIILTIVCILIRILSVVLAGTVPGGGDSMWIILLGHLSTWINIITAEISVIYFIDALKKEGDEVQVYSGRNIQIILNVLLIAEILLAFIANFDGFEGSVANGLNVAIAVMEVFFYILYISFLSRISKQFNH